MAHGALLKPWRGLAASYLCTELIWGPVMEAQGHQTREAWLNYIAERIAPVFENLGAPLLEPRNGFQT